MSRLWRDRQFLVALLVPPLLLLMVRASGGAGWGFLSWPLRQPGRFFGLVLLWPAMEELIFRGALQPFFSEQRWGRFQLHRVTAANGLASLLFAAAHFFSHPPLWAMAVFFPSLLFGYFRDRHGDLLSPVLLHCIYNLGYYWIYSA